MMICGDAKTFAIEYKMLYGDEYPEDWGYIRFWVNDKNLFAFKNNKPAETYHWYIYMFARWLCESLQSLMKKNDFIIPIVADNAFSFLDEVEKYINKFDEESQEQYDLKCELYEWSERHCFFISRGGSFAQEMYIRSHLNNIELMWSSNTIYAHDGVEFLHPEGLEYVSRRDFFNATVEFLTHYLNLPEKQELKSNKELKQILKHTIENVII